ncbi:lamin tail domain-containing protein [Solirubrobacter sp. CPCC 204708]|uniref:Lamin tail domain-containing protein n=1 Tax=Solirubrobacter deserti TaxID=2282478 RepID=A0ABT4RMR5_9ACTN|nr:lamin tail domain-containing protein [Solirubrobacter deserti]MBE2320147.1 lamin tail domain-containing protein [Solirubrobacter deserti]MDA0139867.1 lamin tail domain-containing protein [Solirubrobacter deserti]
MRRIAGIALIALTATAVGAEAAAAQAGSETVVISEFRTRGPAGGNDEFVELRNRSAAPVDISGWLLQGCASGTPGNASTRATVPGGVTLAPNQSYLFANDATGGYSGTVAPDQIYGTGFTDFSSTNFAGIRLVTGSTTVDGVGAPQSPCREGTGITTPTTSTDSAFERTGGTADTNDNAADFQGPKAGDPQNRGGGGDPVPEVESSEPADNANNVARGANLRVTFSEPVEPAANTVSLTCDDTAVAVTVTGESDTVYVLDPQADLPAGATCVLRVEGDGYGGADYSATFTTTGQEGLRIHDIQGAAHLSPYRNTLVAGVEGIVTARRFNGFYIQDPRPDRDPKTSEGIFVFTGSALPAAAQPGAKVSVSGRVTEFRPSCTPSCAAPDFPNGDFGASAYANLTITEIDRATVTASGTGTIRPTLVGRGGRVPPEAVIDNDTPDPQADEPPLITGNVEEPGSRFDPEQDGIDFYESLEGMLTEVRRGYVTEPTNVFSAGAANENAEIAVVTEPSDLSKRGVLPVRAYDRFAPREYRFGDFNPERIILNDPVTRDNDLDPLPNAQVGDRFEDITAVVDYSFGNFKFLVTEPPTFRRGDLKPEVAKPAGRDELSIASYNVENLDAVNDLERMPAIARQIIDNLRSPDILTLSEVQDLDGEGPLGPAGDPTWQALVAAIRAAGGPAYEYRQIDPVHNADGGAPNANIRVGFLFNPRRVEFVDRPGGTSTTGTTENTAQPGAQLTFSPGRIDPTNPAFTNSRKPLAGEFRYRGRPLFVVANHFASKGGDAPLFGRFQEPYRPSEIQRRQQADVVNAWVRSLQRADPFARVVVAGDLNDFEFSESVRILQRGTDERGYELVDLWNFVPQRERYSYIFQGNGQVLDHILVSPPLLLFKPEFDAVHINAEFDDEQLSDHDPPLLRLSIR